MDFDEPVERRGTTSLKWDAVGRACGIEGPDVLPMWVADMDFRTAPVVRAALVELAERGLFGYMSALDAMRSAVAWWMGERHDWTFDPEAILTVHGLGNGIAMALDALTEPGDGVVIFTPVYHEFAARIRAAGRRAVEVPLVLEEGRLAFDLDRAVAMLDGSETLVILCSPQNPGGRVWREDELRAVAHFAAERGLFVVSDEIHHDFVYPGHRHVPLASFGIANDRLVTLTAPSKTFNTAGLRVGHMIVGDAGLRARVRNTLDARSIQPNMAGVIATTAAYSPEGAVWADALVAYLDRNRRTFDAGLNAIPGVRSHRLEATFLAWVDFGGTGMEQAEIEARIRGRARIGASRGPQFGPGGESCMRFNIGTQHARVEEAVARLRDAFSDLQ